MTTKRYPLTIPVELDNICESLVQGDPHYRGSRNQFYIEAIQNQVKFIQGSTPNSPAANSPSAGVLGTAAPEKDNRRLPSPDERSGEAPIAEQPKPPQPKGRKPRLEYRDGAIRSQTNIEYKVVAAPAKMDTESDEEYFNRIKTIPGVTFKQITPTFAPDQSPLRHPLVTSVQDDFRV